MKKQLALIAVILLSVNVFCFAQKDKSIYKITDSIKITGDGWWDYINVDDSTGRLFVSHGNETQIVDSKTGNVLATIEDTKGVHGVTLDKDDNKAFISCGKDSSVVVINLSTFQIIGKIKVTGSNPDAILYDKYSGRVFTFNGRSSNVTVIDAKTSAVKGTLDMPGKPEFAVTDEDGKIYVNIEDKSEIVQFDTKTLKVLNIWDIAPGKEPSGLAIDLKNNLLFSVCDNKLMIILDANTGKVITTLQIGQRTDGCAFDPQLNRVYSSNGDGTLTVVQEINAKKFKVLENVSTKTGARTVCVNKTTHHIYLPTADFGQKPEPTIDNPHPRAPIIPGTFIILDIAPIK